MFKAINNLFSNKHDLLAIGLFTGASIALMLSELFNWLLNDFVSKAIVESSTWFPVVSFFLLFLKLACIAFVLFDIDWLYNKFVRQRLHQTSFTSVKRGFMVQQEAGKTIALEDLKESKSQLKARLKTQLKKDQELQQESQGLATVPIQSTGNSIQANAKSKFIVEYLQGHDEEMPDELEFVSEKLNASRLEGSQDGHTESRRLVVKYRKQDQLHTDLEKPMKNEVQKDEVARVSNTQAIDLIAILKQDLQDADSENKLSKLQKELDLLKPDSSSVDLSPEEIRSVLAKR